MKLLLVIFSKNHNGNTQSQNDTIHCFMIYMTTYIHTISL